MQQGKIVTLSGISGIGKSYLKNYILKSELDFQSLISVTTRQPRTTEIDGIDKFFYSLEEFEKARTQKQLVAVNKVFENWYAYKKSQIELCDAGINLITELFYKNVYEFQNDFTNVIAIYVLPSDVRTAKEKLKERNLEENDLQKRLEDIDKELEFFNNNQMLFDIVITNDYTEKSCLEFKRLIQQCIRSERNV